MKTSLPTSKNAFAPIAFTSKLYLLVFAALFCFINGLYAGIKPAPKGRHIKSCLKHGALKAGRPSSQPPPSVSYASPQIFTAGQTVSVAPSSTGISAYNYNQYSGADETLIPATDGLFPYSVVMDAASNFYFTQAQEVDELVASSGTVQVIASGFNSLVDIKLDASKNIYVTDRGANQVIKIAARGGLKSVIGTGFTSPYGLALDALGNVYVSEATGTTTGDIKKIAAGTGTTTVFATGFGPVGGLAFDAAGDLFLADDGTNVIKEIPADGGGIITVMQNIGGNNLTPNFLAIDHSGTLFVGTVTYIADLGTETICDIFCKLPGGIDTSPIEFDTPDIFSAFTTDRAGNIYVAAVETGFGDGDGGIVKYPPAGGFFISQNLPAGLNFDGNTGIVSGIPLAASPSANYTVTGYQTDSTSGAINPVSTTVNITVNSVSGPQISYSTPQSYPVNYAISGTGPISGGGLPGALNYMPTASAIGSGFNLPNGIAKDAAGNFYIADRGSNEVKKMTSGGGVTVFATGFSKPTGVAVDAAGNVYVADNGNNAVKKIPAGSNTPVLWGSGFSKPLGIAVDGAGNVYVADKGNNAIKEILTNGTTIAIGGSGFNAPAGVAVDAAGNVYVADSGSGSVQRIAPGSGFAQLLTFGLSDPFGVAVDNAGDVFVCDAGASDYAVYRFTTSNPQLNLVGQEFFSPQGIMVDGQGNLYIADTGNNEIRLIQPAGGFFFNTALPAGMVYDSSTGIISGTPTAITAEKNYTVTAWNPAGNSSTAFSLQVTANALLSGLTLSAGTLSPAFTAGTTAYTASVTNTVSSVTITPVTGVSTSTVKINGTAVTSGTPSGPIDLSVGTNLIDIVVTAQDGITTETYSLVITRALSTDAYLSNLTIKTATLSPAFAFKTLTYTASVPGTTSSVTVTPALIDATASIKVNGTTVTNKTASGPIALAPGANTINIVVTAQDGVTEKTYTIAVGRGSNDAYLSNLKVSTATLSPAFAFKTLAYTANVSNGTNSVMVTPSLIDITASSLKVNGTSLANKAASGPIALALGSNTINVTIIAQDGVTTQTYVITINRALSSNDNLANLSLSAGTLSPGFASGTTSYTAAVAATTPSITVTPTTADPTATITVNGTGVASGTASGNITLNNGVNTVNVVVTAQDGVTQKTYTLMVDKGSNDAYLSNLKVTTATLSPTFAFKTLAYTSSVPNTTSSVTVTPNLVDATASSLTVNNIGVANKTASNPIALDVGSNVINIVIIAQDGVTTLTYTVTITRAASGADSYAPIAIGTISVSKPIETPVLAEDGIFVHQGISPNGDGINDFLQIDNIGQYPDNKLSVMNRNGQLVYEAKSYDNSSKVFDGHSNKNGQMQLPGTYFYQLDYTVSGITKHKTGFIVLKY